MMNNIRAYLHLIVHLQGVYYAFSFDLLTFNDFPFEEFFNLTINASSWKQFYLCQQQGQYDARCCGCQDDCWLKRSCCIDKLWTGYEFLTQYLEKFVTQAKKYENMQCRPLIGNADVLESDLVNMVTHCSQNGNFERCSHGHDTGIELPVIGKDENVYQNDHCLRCNGIDKLENFPVKLICNITEGTISTTQSLEYSSCVTRVDSSKPRTHTLIQMCEWFTEKDSCSKNNTDLFLCGSYQAKT